MTLSGCIISHAIGWQSMYFVVIVGIGALETIIKVYFIIGPIHVLDNRLYKSCLTVLLGNIIHCVKYRQHGP